MTGDWVPYMPSNGTEGLMFEGRFCNRCIHGKSPDGCTILGLAYGELQPAEWRRRSGSGFPGEAECTAFGASDE